MSRIANLTESLLPQPPSFAKKKQYEILDVLGTGSFGKVMVRRVLCLVYPIHQEVIHGVLFLDGTGGKVACTLRYGQHPTQ